TRTESVETSPESKDEVFSPACVRPRLAQSIMRNQKPLFMASPRKGRCVLAQPFLELGMRGKFGDFDPVDRRTGFAHALDVCLRHFPNPNDTMSLQSAARQVHVAFVERQVEVAAVDQYEVDQIA